MVRPEKMERGAKVTVGDFKQLKKAWEEYDEWSEDYAWQQGESAYVVDLDEADGTVLLKFVEEAPEIKEKEEDKPKITFQTAPIKHIKQKTLAPFKKKFSQSFMFFYRVFALRSLRRCQADLRASCRVHHGTQRLKGLFGRWHRLLAKRRPNGALRWNP